MVPFSNGVDDIVSARLAMQLAENEKVKVTLVHVESTSEFQEALAAIEKIIPQSVADRFNIVTRTERNLVAAVGALLQGDDNEGSAEPGDAPDNLVLIGRNSDAKDGDGSLFDASKVVGSYADGCIKMLSQIGTQASMLVVQAKKD